MPRKCPKCGAEMKWTPTGTRPADSSLMHRVVGQYEIQEGHWDCPACKHRIHDEED